jgi:ABC-type ATPase involved in cell division/GNAT superfamily N-acetyltransferase
MRPIFEITVEADDFTKAASTAFDYKFEGKSTFQGWEKPQVPEDFSLGLIIGPSGSGKSLLLRQFGQEENPQWNPNKATVSHFENPNDALDRLMAVGLNSIPSWCRPFHVLSNGEQFRAGLARKLKNGAVIDEFTSVVDRNVAKAASVAMRRFIDRKGLKKIVLASCHYDILDWLRPDWYFDTVDGILHDGRSLQRPSIEVKIYPCRKDSWAIFAKHHYLTGDFNKAAKAYLATATFEGDIFDEWPETIVGFASALPMPCGTLKNAWREHRTVVLPDFQGLGLGPKISDAVAQIHLDEGKRYFSRTAHPRFGAYRDRSPLWKKTSKYKKLRSADEVSNSDIKGFDFTRTCFSHEYVGKL